MSGWPPLARDGGGFCPASVIPMCLRREQFRNRLTGRDCRVEERAGEEVTSGATLNLIAPLAWLREVETSVVNELATVDLRQRPVRIPDPEIPASDLADRRRLRESRANTVYGDALQPLLEGLISRKNRSE